MSERAVINGFPNYTIDTDGNVFNKNNIKLKPRISNSGYARVSLSNDKVKHKHLSVHRLVAETFISNPNNLPQVNHKDENKLNNNVSNLERCTPLYNLQHSRVIEKATVAKFTKIRCDTTGEEFASIREACSKYGLKHANIVACCKGRRNTCGGYLWSYAESEA